MRPVDQTRFGYPEGNCLVACVASIIEVEICDLPDLFDSCRDGDGKRVEGGEHWFDILNEGVMGHGWLALWRSAPHEIEHPTEYMIEVGPSGRSFNEDGVDVGHCIVSLDGVMVHDPHPDRSGLCGPTKYWIELERLADSA